MQALFGRLVDIPNTDIIYVHSIEHRLTPTVLMRFLDDNIFAGAQGPHHPDPGGAGTDSGADVDADATHPPEAATASAKGPSRTGRNHKDS